MKEFKVTDETVRSIAETCQEAKWVLEKTFLEAFEKSKYFNIRELSMEEFLYDKHAYLFSEEKAEAAGFKDNKFMLVQTSGEFAFEAFLLDDSDYDWRLVRNGTGDLCLIPTRKNLTNES